MMNEAQVAELSALFIWLQTFPGFGRGSSETEGLTPANKILEALGDQKTAKTILKIAHEVCDADYDEGSDIENQTTDSLWTATLMLTSTRARPLISNETNTTKLPPELLKLYVLSNLLDCTVQYPNREQRRKYIERMMGLEKHTQKTLMALIERRNKRSSDSGNRAPKSIMKKTPPSKLSRAALFPKTPESARRASAGKLSPQKEAPSQPDQTPPSTKVLGESNTTSQKSSARSHSIAFTDPTGTTPESKRAFSGNVGGNTFLSPGVLDSPNQMQSIVIDLKEKNEQFQKILESYKKREDDLTQRMERMEADHRKELIKAESNALCRERELQQQYEDKIITLENELKEQQEKSSKGEAAMSELTKARDELELMKHDKSVLSETTEQLKKLKEKVVELQDVKEALSREQEAHGKSVDEVVRLENELQALKPLKRQLEDYKIRAIEAEVKLVESQDYIRRIEQQATNQSAANDYLWKGAVMQKEQLEELQRRIQEDLQSQQQTGAGVGEGISELNPELRGELIRLRNENLQLRAFASKRENDEVQRLEEQLEDAKKFIERYKSEFLLARKNYEETEQQLHVSKKREDELHRDVRHWETRAANLEELCQSQEEKNHSLEQQLKQAKKNIAELEIKNSNLRNDASELSMRLERSESISQERKTKLEQLHVEFEKISETLARTKAALEELNEEKVVWEQRAEAESIKRGELEEELQSLQEQVTDARLLVSQWEGKALKLEADISKLKDEKAKLQLTLEEERQGSHESLEESQRALDATRSVLEAKAKKDLEELQRNMNLLLEDERKASRQKEEEASKLLREEKQRWGSERSEMQERFASALKNSREESQQRINLLKEQHQEELEKSIREAENSRNDFIRKGKAMLAEAKEKAKQNLQAVEDKRQLLEEQLENLSKEKQELEHLLRSKVSTLKKKLDYTEKKVADLNEEVFSLNDNIKALERENYNLREDNETYRRQLGGRFGADGKLHSQLEKLQKEYMDVVAENKQLRNEGSNNSASSDDTSSAPVQYTSGGASEGNLSELHKEYERVLQALTNERRELIMRNSAAQTDVQKAEQRAWEREQEVAKLKEDISSLKVALARAELSHNSDTASRDTSFFSAHEDEQSLESRRGRRSPLLMVNSALKPSRRSPSIERALQQKVEQENDLRTRLSLLTGTPPRHDRTGIPRLLTKASPESTKPLALSEVVLSPTRKHEEAANRSPRKGKSKAGETPVPQVSNARTKHDDKPTLIDFTKPQARAESDSQLECKQS